MPAQLMPARPPRPAGADEDLSAIVLLAHSVSMRLPIGAPISHAEALMHCKARLGWLRSWGCCAGVGAHVHVPCCAAAAAAAAPPQRSCHGLLR